MRSSTVLINKMVATLRELKMGEKYTYHEIFKKTGLNPQHSNGYVMRKAYRLLLDEGLVFEAVYSVGIKRLTDAEISVKARKYLAAANSAAIKSDELLGHTDVRKLTADQRCDHNTVKSVTTLAKHIFADAMIFSISRRVSRLGIALDLTSAIQAISQVSKLNEEKRIQKRTAHG